MVIPGALLVLSIYADIDPGYAFLAFWEVWIGGWGAAVAIKRLNNKRRQR